MILSPCELNSVAQSFMSSVFIFVCPAVVALSGASAMMS